MNWNQTKLCSAAALSAFFMTTLLGAAEKNRDPQDGTCAPEPAAPCYNVDTYDCDICLGPDMTAVNPAVRPRACNGAVLTVAAFVWKATEDGLAYAVDTAVQIPDEIAPLSLIHARDRNPNFQWDFGFKLGLGYNTHFDGWDFNLLWTHFRNRAPFHRDSDSEDNKALLPYYSAGTGLLFVTDMRGSWKLELDLVDLEMGREFWVSKYLTLRPFVGLRYARLSQDYDINSFGGILNDSGMNDYVDMDNDFKGTGVRLGLDGIWNIGRGFALYSKAALSLLWGRFDIEQEEYFRSVSSPFTKTPLLSKRDSFHAVRAATDLELGLQWSARFDDCRNVFTLSFGWEAHHFFNQNQLWHISTLDPISMSSIEIANTYAQSRGDLSTQGWTLTAKFEF